MVRVNVWVPSLWKEYWPTPKVAVAAIDKEIDELKNVKGVKTNVNKKKKQSVSESSEPFISNAERRVAYLQWLKKQALQALQYVKTTSPYSQHISEEVDTSDPNPDDYIVHYYGDLDERQSISADD